MHDQIADPHLARKAGGNRFTPALAATDVPVIGGQFRLAGMQPRRRQILEFPDWYER